MKAIKATKSNNGDMEYTAEWSAEANHAERNDWVLLRIASLRSLQISISNGLSNYGESQEK